MATDEGSISDSKLRAAMQKIQANPKLIDILNQDEGRFFDALKLDLNKKEQKVLIDSFRKRGPSAPSSTLDAANVFTTEYDCKNKEYYCYPKDKARYGGTCYSTATNCATQ